MLKILKEKIKEVRFKIPLPLRFIYDVPYWIYSQAKKMFFALYPQVFVAENGNAERNIICLAYVGALESQKEYWFQKVFSEDFREYYLGRHLFWKVPHILKKNYYDCSLLICGANIIRKQFLSSCSGYFHIPYWIEMDVDISLPQSQLPKNIRETYKSIFRKIKKFKLSYEVSKDMDRFEDFYHNMYIPYTKCRYGKTAFVENYAFAKDVFSRSELIFIKQNDVSIAGHLIEYKGKHVYFHMLGVKNGDFEYIKQGAACALDYFSLIELQNRGYKKVHFGGCRPFFNDGVTRYKISLAAKAVSHDKVMKDHFSLLLLKNSSEIRNFLKENPFVFAKRKNTFCRAFFLELDQFESERDFTKYLNHNNCNGLQHTYFFTFHEDKTLSSWLKSYNKTSFSIKPAKLYFPE